MGAGIVSVLAAVAVLLAILLVIDLSLTAGIVVKLRILNTAGGLVSAAAVQPPVGHIVDLSADGVAWPAAAHEMTGGDCIVVLVFSHCPGCQRLHHEMDAFGNLPFPLFVIGDPFTDAPQEVDRYLATWRGAIPVPAPASLFTLKSMGEPNEMPTIMLLRDGLVVASGHNLRDVSEAMFRVNDRIAH